MRPKKLLGLSREVRPGRAKWGQNFLKDPKILKKIADFARIRKNDVILEVGAGEGTLTESLLQRAKKVIAIEKDEKLANFLVKKFKNQKLKIKIICGDILKIENLLKIAKLKIKNYVLVGNIPYYITGALFKKFLESKNQPKSITFVIQKEVAERIMAKDGKESVLSISIKVYGKPEFGSIIKAGSFYPRPKVDSAIISVRDISRKRFEKTQRERFSSESLRVSSLRSARLSSENFPAGQKQGSEKGFFEILKAGFAHKRKLLIKNLGAEKEVFKKCKIPEKARAENLSVENWICLAENLL